MKLIFAKNWSSQLFDVTLPTTSEDAASLISLAVALQDMQSANDLQTVLKLFKKEYSIDIEYQLELFETARKFEGVANFGFCFGLPIVQNGNDYLVIDISEYENILSPMTYRMLRIYDIITKSVENDCEPCAAPPDCEASHAK
jgi:hypothetical protein